MQVAASGLSPCSMFILILDATVLVDIFPIVLQNVEKQMSNYKTSNYKTLNFKKVELQNLELQNANLTKDRKTKRRITIRWKLQKVE